MSLSRAKCHSGWKNVAESAVIKCHLSKLMGERKLKISDVARDTGLHRNTITLLYQETANRVDLDAIDVLCRYFNVPIQELLEWRDEEPAKPS